MRCPFSDVSPLLSCAWRHLADVSSYNMVDVNDQGNVSRDRGIQVKETKIGGTCERGLQQKETFFTIWIT
jgi:hypothetical protein